MRKSVVTLAAIASFVVTMLPSVAFAETETSKDDITIIPINEEISLQKTVAVMVVPDDNMIQQGAVKGEASDFVERYPVIIQFFKGEEPVHVAQVNVKGDGSYEYKFRVRNTDDDTGKVTNIFEGQYTVKIFKVIHSQNKEL